MADGISNTEKEKCRYMLTSAIKKGYIVRPDKCTVCNMVDCTLRELSGHHFDYTKPLDVVWVCTKCHGIIHAIMSSKVRNGLDVDKNDIITTAKYIWENKNGSEVPYRMYEMVAKTNSKSAVFHSINDYYGKNCIRRIQKLKNFIGLFGFDGVKGKCIDKNKVRLHQPVSIHHETRKRITNVYLSFGKGMKFSGFIDEILEFWLKYHCPECGECTAEKKKHHKC